jgi:ribonucleoside-diphosphate reductase alpha chain
MSKKMTDPYANINFVERQAQIIGTDGTLKFNETVEFPDYFDDNSVAIVASKYLCNNAKIKEKSLKDLINRVSNTITDWGIEQNYFDKKESQEFNYKLKYYQARQYFAFNSPVYFNCGLRDNPQLSACFILNIDDNMDSIFDTAKLESRIFKQGSGSGMNISKLRSNKEPVSGGGFACLTGNTKIVNDYQLKKFGRENSEITILDLYNRKLKGKQLPKIRCVVDDLKLGSNQVIDIVYNGKQQVYEIETETGYKIKATHNHRFLSTDGYKQLSDFYIGETIAVNGKTQGICKQCKKNKQVFDKNSINADLCYSCVLENKMITGICERCKKERKLFSNGKYKNICSSCSCGMRSGYDVYEEKIIGECLRCGKERELRGKNSKFKGMCESCAFSHMQNRCIHGTDEFYEMRCVVSKEVQNRDDVIEKKRVANLAENNHMWKGNEANKTTARQRLYSLYPEIKEIKICEICNDKINRIEVHHKDGNVYNNERENLEILCSKCHQKEHARRRALGIFELTKEVFFDKIIKITECGIEDVYDIQMQTPYHNFIANGFVSHNSGPVSFMKAHDTIAGVIRSGGTLRRSAKLVCLDIDHPDIEEFIACKIYEEQKLQQLRNAEIKPKAGHELSDEVFFQNTNISVRLTKDFMEAVKSDGDFFTKYVTTGTACNKYRAKDLLKNIAQRAWECADPGVQYHDNTNIWNTCKNSGSIDASNPCGEFVFINNSACNLASINLYKFFKNNEFNIKEFLDVIKTVVYAQDIVINKSSYPNEEITNNSKKFRPIGLGYTNLGTILMETFGVPYDSDQGRLIASKITSMLTGYAYIISNEIATKLGSFDGFEENKKSFYDVLDLHLKHAIAYFKDNLCKTFGNMPLQIWEDVNKICINNGGFRNAQTTLLAPTGTISFLMGAATTGIEPEYSHVKFKNLAGTDGGAIKIINPHIENTLKKLNYNKKEIKLLKEELLSNSHLEESSVLSEEHIPIFDTSCKPYTGERSIHYLGHVKMLAAVQPFLSGAISKTVNCPNDITVDDIYNLYLEAWKMGLKGITIYREGSKTFQAITTSESKDEKKIYVDDDEKFTAEDIIELKNQLEIIKEKVINRKTVRKKLNDTRSGTTHKFTVGGTTGYITTGVYDDGSLGEVFIKVAKQGSTLAGLVDTVATLLSISIQYGVPLKVLVDKLTFQQFEPHGFTKNPEIGYVTSIIDYIGKYLGLNYLSEKERDEINLKSKKQPKTDDIDIKEVVEELVYKICDYNIDEFEEDKEKEEDKYIFDESSPSCPSCGSILVRKGSCFMCPTCAFNEGACG